MSTSGRWYSRSRMRCACLAAVQHDMRQGVCADAVCFYEQLIHRFERDPASLKDTIGEMVYSMDVDQQVHRACVRREFDSSRRDDGCADAAQAEKKLEGLDLAGGQAAEPEM